MVLPIAKILTPMEAVGVDRLPSGPQWSYEPKWDGFRCVVYRDGDAISLISKHDRPLARYFPELVRGLLTLPPRIFVLDTEIMLRQHNFDLLQLRLHPATSRIKLLAQQHPAMLIAFDMLVDVDGRSLIALPFRERRQALESFIERCGAQDAIALSPNTTSRVAAERQWLSRAGAELDGVVAKRLDLRYAPGRRCIQKVKRRRTIDCVIGGLYLDATGKRVNGLLLGLYDNAGKLNYVGQTRVARGNAAEFASLLRPLIGGPGFTGQRRAGAVSRWSGRSHTVVPLEHKLVAEVEAEHIAKQRLRHAAPILRWRPDKAPRDCTLDQIG